MGRGDGGHDRSAQALGYLSSGIWGGISAGPVVGHWMGSFENAAMFQTIAAVVGVAGVEPVTETYKGHTTTGERKWIPVTLIKPGIAIGFVNVHYPVIRRFLILHLANYGNSGPAAFSAYACVVLTSRFFLAASPTASIRQSLSSPGWSAWVSASWALRAGPRLGLQLHRQPS